MFVAEWPDRDSTYDKHSDRISFAKQRQAKMGAKASEPLGFVQCIVWIGENIDNLYGSALQLHSSNNPFASRRKRKSTEIIVIFLCVAIARCGVETMTAETMDKSLRERAVQAWLEGNQLKITALD